ncbi:VPLPA-CTERM sorting domain-containing protein [uncultured Thiohalocapsa sp.]|mgnify:CR=1 FL=1|uniref:VPLPA-CTERM sorting domain-containing protein n=1 Tax=uncultured Thiohalocapsa sp. TaxID=768990 RepID=UPI0025D4E47F|nr:VPLPA-CTERM sorting domain-containing protein [uncultured Thiohalocapsa sp.]
MRIARFAVAATLLAAAGAAQAALTFTNPTSVAIGPDEGAASPYPSSILVSGAGTDLLSLTVDFFDLSLTWPSDVHAVLEGPTGAAIVLMANAGRGFDFSDVDLTFDDAAAGPLPFNAQIVSGTYQVSQYNSAETMPAPAPSPAFGTNLSAFAGLDPNGTWSLWLYDDTNFDGGSLAGGWGLNLEAAQAPVPASALLLLTGLGALAGVGRVCRR